MSFPRGTLTFDKSEVDVVTSSSFFMKDRQSSCEVLKQKDHHYRKRFVFYLYWKGWGNSWWGIGEKTIIRHFTNVQFANALGHFDNTLDHHKALESLFNLVFLTSWNGSQKSWHWNKYSQILCVGRGRGMVEGGNTIFFLYEVVLLHW